MNIKVIKMSFRIRSKYQNGIVILFYLILSFLFFSDIYQPIILIITGLIAIEKFTQILNAQRNHASDSHVNRLSSIVRPAGESCALRTLEVFIPSKLSDCSLYPNALLLNVIPARQRHAKFSASNFLLTRKFGSELNSMREIQASARKFVEIGPRRKIGG